MRNLDSDNNPLGLMLNPDYVQGKHNRQIQTFTGKLVDPTRLMGRDLDIRDIAHALANTCRYTGNCRFHYSVAQHCVLMANYVFSRTNDFGLAFQALMHDASEAYLNDIANPVKMLPEMVGYRDFENQAMRVIAAAFGFDWPVNHLIASADLLILAVEKAVLFEHQPQWNLPYVATPANRANIPINRMGPEVAEGFFLKAFDEYRKGSRLPLPSAMSNRNVAVNHATPPLMRAGAGPDDRDVDTHLLCKERGVAPPKMERGEFITEIMFEAKSVDFKIDDAPALSKTLADDFRRNLSDAMADISNEKWFKVCVFRGNDAQNATPLYVRLDDAGKVETHYLDPVIYSATAKDEVVRAATAFVRASKGKFKGLVRSEPHQFPKSLVNPG